MKKNLTRILAMAMALLMCLSLLPASALAGDIAPAVYLNDPAAAYAAAMAAAAGGGTFVSPDMALVMADQMADYTNPNVCLASDDGQHLFMEIIKPEYLCEAGDCDEEYPHILYKSCAYCKQSAEWLYLAALEEVNAEVSMMSSEEAQALMDDPDALAALEYRYKQYIFEVPDHIFVKVDGQAPNCTTGGISSYEQCAVCDELRGYEELDPLGHNWGDYTVTVEPTCTAAGTKMRECLRCGEKDYADIPALGHDWGEFVTLKEPTCTETGTTKRVCERCGAEDFGEIPAKGHSYGDFTVTKEATCTEDGSKEHTCTVCEYLETVVIPAGHTWGEFSVTVPATCVAAGEKEHSCLVCETVETETIPATGVHTWNEDGLCAVCGAAKPAEKDEQPKDEQPKDEQPKGEEPKGEEPKDEEITLEEPAKAQPVGAIVDDCRDMYASFGAFLSQQGVADAKYVVASYTPVDANGQALSAVPEGGVRFALPLPEGADAASVQIYTYDYSTYSWSPANFFLSDGQATVSSGAYPFPPFAVLAAPAAAGGEGENGTTPTKQEAVSAETADAFKNLLNEKGLSSDSDNFVLQDVTPLREDGTEMSNEEVAAMGGVTFEMDLPENYEEGDELEYYHQNSETGEWELVTNYEIRGNKVILRLDHFSPVGGGVKKGGGATLLGAGAGTITNVFLYVEGEAETAVSQAYVGNTLHVKVEPAGSYEYAWYRQTGNSSNPDDLISNETGETYVLKDGDCPYGIYCRPHVTGDIEDGKFSNGVHIRKTVALNITKPTNGGTVIITDTDLYSGSDPRQLPLNDPIYTLSENKLEIKMTPNSDEGYYVRSLTEIDGTKRTQLRGASKGTVTYTFDSSTHTISKNQDGHTLELYFDIPKCEPSASPLTEQDKAYSHTSLESDFRASHPGTSIAYYYVAPVWNTGGELSKDDIKAVNGFSFDLDLPNDVTVKEDYFISAYHYDGTKWNTVSYEDVEGELKVRIKNFTDFSPFAVVAEKSVKLNLEPGESASTAYSIAAKKNTTETVPECTFTPPADKTFDCWKDTAANKTYNPGEPIALGTDDVTLTAQWKLGYTVKFEKGDPNAEGSISDMHVTAGESITLPTGGYTLTNYKIEKWKDQDNTQEDAGADVTPTKDLTYTAQWKRTHITISYDPNGGTGSIDSQSAPVGSNVNLTKNGNTSSSPIKPSNANQMFAGWSKTSGGDVDFTDGQTIDVAADLNNTDATLYAVWRDSVKIHYSPESDSGTGSGTAYYQTVPANVDWTLAANKFTPPSSSMAFAGWNDRQDGTGTDYVDQGTYKFNGETYLYAQWGPAITVTYDKNSPDATGTMAAQKVAANESFKLSDLAYSNPAYEFLGWAKTSGGTPVYNDGELITDGFPDNTTLYAKWDKQGFTGAVKVTGDVSGSSGTAYVGETLTATVTNETVFTEFDYVWKRDDGKVLTAVEGHPDQYVPTADDFGHEIVCEVTAKEATKNPKSKTSAPKEVGIDSTTKRIVNNGQTEADFVTGLVEGMTYTINNGAAQEVPGPVMPVTQQGVYRFYKDGALVGIVDVENWYTVGYVNATSTSTASSGANTSGSGTITAKATYDGTERSLTTSTTIKDTTTGEVVLQPYVSIGGYDHVWIVKQDSGVGFYLTVKPASGSYGHVGVNGGNYDSSSAERTYRVDPVSTYAMYSVIFNRSSTSPRTADDSHLGLWSALCFMSLAGVAVLLNGQRRRRKARR